MDSNDFSIENLLDIYDKDINYTNEITSEKVARKRGGDVLTYVLTNDLTFPQPFTESDKLFEINDTDSQNFENEYRTKIRGKDGIVKTTEMETFFGTHWLLDNDIDAYSYLLNLDNFNNGRRFFMLPASINKEQGSKTVIQNKLQSIIMNMNYKLPRYEFQLNDFIWNYLIPFNIADVHWILLHYNMIDKSITIYDSLMGNLDINEAAKEKQNLLQLITNSPFTKAFASDFDIIEYDKNQLTLQRDSSSCGIFTLYYAYILSGFIPENQNLSKKLDVLKARKQIFFSTRYKFSLYK